MAEVSKADLEKEIEKILKNANLAKTSTKKVIQKLEEVFDTDLSDKKKMIDQLVMDYVNNQASDEEDEEEASEEEEDKKPPKKAAKPAPKKRKASTDEDDDANGTNDSDSEEEKKKPAKKGKKKKGDSDSDWGKKTEKAAKPKKAGGRGKASGYTRAYKLSPALAELMGKDEMPRHEVVKQVWTIIKEKNLYDPNNKQFAICDDALYKVIGTKRFRTFGMMKYLKTHFLDE
ncbi:upstream activation factor subunit spp27 [Aricia agestis]|uniref:upstream activation factor subunit spp27 n=1 Tax=Aricia agestis TaxID=91739 RepID=UPI001C203ED7|nr:upstream activation factor subunit spp27 [Aricia agestis]